MIDTMTKSDIAEFRTALELLIGPATAARFCDSHEALRQQVATLAAERDKAAADFKEMTGCRDHAVMQREWWWQKHEDVIRERDALREERDRQEKDINFAMLPTLERQGEPLNEAVVECLSRLRWELASTNAQGESLKRELAEARAEIEQWKAGTKRKGLRGGGL